VLAAATPGWFADNITIIALGGLIALTVLVVLAVKESVTRTVLLVIIAAAAVFVVLNRDPLKACASTCECEIADQHLSVPFCDPDRELSSRITPAPRRA
jgi:hypothetical protein